eukprot:gnl/TRDRNA2_/TRDRNA2_195866_c0_seq1.p1 gnl/TRDRNA2_/TRDRNA2_195866_c0~~gnl/TRDRNA2_/TRDRNA2_195866_c0_seq1.p1  ORF type:complete len:702 (+),score=143.82 gnl/TRDRNA2_/TRDRNA2_195866_c0_seq1:308-2107(+)
MSGGVDATNEMFSALGIRVRIVEKTSEDARTRVRVVSSDEEAVSCVSQGITPRQFVKFMREAMKQTGTKKLEASVDRMMAEGRVKPFPLLPESYQRQLYIHISQLLVYSMQRTLLSLDQAHLWGHSLDVTATPCFDDGHARHHRVSAVGEAQISIIVDEMVKSNAVHMPMVPRPAEKMLYTNCMMVVFQLIEELLTGDGSQIAIMGHSIRFQLKPLPVSLVRAICQEHPVRHCHIDEEVISELVDELLQDSSINIVWMPDAMEGQLYRSALKLVIRVLEDVVCRMQLSVLGRTINMSILSHEEMKMRKSLAGRGGDSAEASGGLYFEESEPLKTVSTTELEDRLKEIREERRIVNALLDLGSADFDLTQSTPMLQMNSYSAEAGAHSKGENVETVQEEMHEFHRLAHSLKLGRSLGLSVEIDVGVAVPYMIIADLEGYPDWMPWCTSGQLVGKKPGGTKPGLGGGNEEFDGDVGFGFDTGTFLGHIGDTVHYHVTTEAPGWAGLGSDGRIQDSAIAPDQSWRVLADATNGFSYGRRLAYDWRFIPLSPSKTKVQLDMFFEAKSVLYMPVWDSMQNMVVRDMMKAFKGQVEVLRKRNGSD